jgi:quercetin dioxygenase-like cupin family protein
MKKNIIVFILSAIFTFTTFLMISPAVASPLTINQTIELVRPDEGKTFRVGEDFITFKTLNQDIPGELSFIEITAAPQSGPALHKHPPEVFYIIDGEFEFYGSRPEDTIKATRGDLIHIPSGAPHAYKNVGITPGKYLLVSGTVGNPEQLWFQKFEYEISQKLGTPVTDKSKSSVAVSKSLDKEEMASIARKNGIEFLD